MSPKRSTGAWLALLAILTGCDDNKNIVRPDPALVARGEYLVEHVIACGECHTPRDTQGRPDETRKLAGAPLFADLVPGVDSLGAIPVPNLTPHATGLLAWTDEEIRAAILDGRDEDGDALFPIMPYWVFHNLTRDDADAIVAYLRSIPPVDNPLPGRQPLGFPFTTPAQPIPVDQIPATTLSPNDAHYLNAVRGRYLAGMAGLCIDCHTPPPATPGPQAVDLAKLFAGGRVFEAAEFGLPSPPFPAEIRTQNITPDATGIAAYTPETIRRLLHTGVDENSLGVCPPMPAGPQSPYGGLTDQDALDIGWYLTTIPPVVNLVEDCQPPP